MGNDEGQGLNPTVDFIAGTIAGIANLVVGFPFDTVKVRFQSPDIASKYRSTFHAITTIVREERFIGLYKGITSPLATAALMNGLIFASYRFLLKLQLPTPDTVPSIAQIALAGAGCGIISSIVTAPTELIKIRQQSQLTRTTARQVAFQILRESGLRGLFRGIVVTALRDCGYGAYFAAYEATCRYFSSPMAIPNSTNVIVTQLDKEYASLSWPALLLAGGVAGIVGWVATFPLDVVKTRMQGSQPIFTPAMRSSTTSPLPMEDSNPYRTMSSTIINSYRDEGIKVFFKGLSPTLIRAIPVNMVTFAVFEVVVHLLS